MSTARGIGRSAGQTLDVKFLQKPMIVRFTSPQNPDWELLVNSGDLLDALREEGVFRAPDGTRERLEALVAKMEADPFRGCTLKELREVLNPTPPFQFPRAHAAVIRGRSKNGYNKDFTRIRGTWRDVDGVGKSESQIREQFTDLRVLHEGMVVDTPDPEPTEDDIPEG